MKKIKDSEISVTIAFKGRKRLKSLVRCLRSFLNQTLPVLEMIVVGSEFDLTDLHKYFLSKERKKIKVIYSESRKNEARNIGIKACRGDFVIFADHDMQAADNLIESCFNAALKYDVLFIPEKGAGGNFWENCRKLQKEFIHYDTDTISPRFFKRNIFSSGEKPFSSDFGELDEWGFNMQIAKKKIPIGIADSYLLITEDNLTLFKEIRNKFKRGSWMPGFYKVDKNEAWRRVDPIKRGIIFYSKRINYLFTNPIFFLGLLFFKAVSLLAFFSGAFVGLFIKRSDDVFLKEQTKNLYDTLSDRYLFDMYESTDWNKYINLREKKEVGKIWDLGNNTIEKQKILDLGMGPGRWPEFLLRYKFNQVVGLDISPKMVGEAQRRIKDKRFKAVIGDIEKLPFPRNSFDKVFCFRTFKYLPDPRRALAEMINVLKDDGEILLEFTNNNIQNRIFKFISHFIFNSRTSLESKWRYFNKVNFYSLNEFKKMLTEFDGATLGKPVPLFVVPSAKMPQKLDKLSKALALFDNCFMRILPKNLFARSWLITITKKESNTMKILGLTYHGCKVHDNSVALLEDGKILFAEAEERISRIKHDGRFPYLALKEALEVTKTKISDIDYFVSATPDESYLRKFLTTIKFIPYVGLKNYLEQVFKKFIYSVDRPSSDGRPVSIQELNIPKRKFFTVSHYLAHAASTYYSGPFDKCLVICMDGYGPGEKGEPLSGKIYWGENEKLTSLEDVPVHGSLGLYYGVVTKALGFKLNDGEGKTMGLAAYGDPSKCYLQMEKYFPKFGKGNWIIRSSIMDILNVPREEIFEKSRTLGYLRKLIKRYGRENVAASCQKVFEEELEKYVRYLVNKYKIRKVSAAGGIFLNVKANMRLLKNNVIDDLFIYPNPTDGGTAVGAAIAGFSRNGKEIKREEILHSAYGRNYSNSEILKELKEMKGIVYKSLGKELARETAKLLVDGKVVGWFQGRGEWGPRALGQRSVIADPRYIKTKNRINDILKGREWFMPFAPSMLIERAPDYLKTLKKAPFMIIADDINKSRIKDIRAVIHVDKTARPQLVTKEANPLYYQVIKEFEKITKVGVILNTSFNKHGLPIVYTPKQAIEHLLWGAVDGLVIGDFYVKRK